MKKKFLSVLLPFVLLFVVFSGFIPFSFFSGIESPIFLQSKLLFAPLQEGQKIQTPQTNIGVPIQHGTSVTSVGGYTFSQSTTTYTPAYGGTLLCNTSCDDQSYAVTLPFSFTYNGVAYTSIAVSNNGYIQMGTSSVSGYTPICTGTYFNIISPFAQDLMGNVASGDSLRYLTTGTTPNRVFTIEWSKWGMYNSGSPYNEMDFQIKLYETTNVIQFVYKPETPTITNTSVTCGLSGATTTDFNLRTSSTSWSSTIVGSTNCTYMTFSSSIYPSSGLTFTWTPPYVASGNMGYVSSTTIKLNPGAPYTIGTTNNQIIQIQVVDTGVTNPFILNKFKIGLNGTNNPSVDIQNAKLWYTRSSSTFAMTRQYGSSVSYPTGAYYFTDTATLDPNATNYFWLTFDIGSGAVTGDSVNASCDSIFASSPMGNVVPTVTSPPGANLLDYYCFGTYTYVGLSYGLYVTNVTFGNINNSSGCPGSLPYVYSNYTNLSTVVRQNNPYPISITDQNVGNPNACAFGIWIDWNNNYSMLDPGEWYPTTIIPANTTTVATATINVPSTATVGAHRMRIRTNLASAPAQSTFCSNLTYGEQEDYTIIVAPDTNMTYSSSTTTQTNLSNIFAPAVNQQILGLQVVTSGNISPISASAFSFGTNGSTNPSNDITNAKLWYTGSNPNFATTTFIGSVTAPNGPFTINTPRTLVSGTNYFWLTYDVPTGATVGDSVDAICNSVTVGGIVRVPAVTAPAGSRIINGTAICGTYSIPSVTYPTIASAIADLNSKGGVTCPTVFNVAANYVEVASNLTITASGTAANTITFQKSGSGANPCIVAAPGTGTYDGVIKLYGADYYIFDGIDVRDTSANTTTTTLMEWGYALLRPDGNNGCQNNTIKNCNITLNKTNTASYGIYSYYMTTAGVTNTPLIPAGTNSNNGFYNLNISNCYNGMYLYSYPDGTSPYSLGDHNNIVSTTGGGRTTITNFGGSSTNTYGIYSYYQSNITLSNLYINSRGGTTSTGYIYGIYNYSYYNNGNTVITGDTISLVDTIGSTNYMYGIYNYMYYGYDNIVTDNVITGCINYTSSYYSYYIYNYCYGAGSSYVRNNYLLRNKIIGNTFGNSTATTTYCYDIYNYGFASGKNYVWGNLDSGNVVQGTTAYTYYQLYNYGIADTSICNNNKFKNNVLSGTTATATMYGMYDYYYQSYLYHQIDSNVIANNTSPSTSSASYYCMYQYTGAAQTDVSNNTVSGNLMNGTGTLYSMYINYYTAPPVGSTFNVTNNNLNNQQKATATGTGTIYGIYYSNPVAGTVNINNNTITGFSSAAATTMYGLYQSSSPTNTLNVNNNKIYNLTTGGASTIYGLYNAGTTTTQATVSQDSIYNLTSLGGTVYGLYLTGGNPVNAYKNAIYGLTSSTGTAGVTYGIYVSSGTIVNLFNNSVSDLKTPASTSIAPAIAGIYLSGGTYLNVYYNTVYLNASSTGTSFGTAALYASTTPTGIDLRNNVFVNNSTPGTTSGLTVAFRRSATGFTNLLTSNNNCFYAGTPATNRLIFYDGTNSDQTLTAYKTRAVPRDNNSVTELPPFINVTTTPYDLHINTGTATQLESGGQTITTPPINITEDAFGTPRYPNSGYPVGSFTPTNPDIGFHEFGGTITSGVGPFISYTPLGTGGTSNRTFSNVIITAPAGVNVTSGTKPRVYYKRSTDGTSINDNTSATDGWKYVEANGTTSPFDFTIDYSKLYGGTGVSAGNTVYYFVVAQDLATTPNFSANQATFAVAPTTVALTATNTPIANYLSYTIGTGIFSGTIPVGTGQTYTSLTGAAGVFAAINAGTVTGDITISVTSDLVEDGVNQLNALNESGVGRYKVKIVPATSGVKTISGWVSQAMVRLNGVKRVTVDGDGGFGGKNLLFRNKYGTTPTIQFQNETGVDTIKNCTIEGANTSTSSGIIFFGSTTNTAGIGNDSICINTCDIRDRSDSTAYYANGIYSYGTSTTLQTYNNYNSIINCNIFNYYYDAAASYAGIYIYYYSSNWKISGNSFYQTSSRAPVNAINAYDIYIYNTTNWDFSITNNYFGGTAPSCGGTPLTYNSAAAYSIYGIYMYISYLNTPSSIQGNTFANVNLTTSPAASSSAFYRPIFISLGYVNIGNLSGNTIGSGTGTGNINLTTNTSTSSYTIGLIYHAGIGAIMNNTIGSITYAGTSTGTADSYYMIFMSNTTYGQIYTISNNLIGSLATANSIQCTNQTNFHAMRGIYCTNGAGTTNYYTNNIVANLTSTSAIVSSSYLCSIYGIQHNSASVASPCYFTGNTVRNLTINSNVALASYALLGIGASGSDFNTVTNNSVYSLYSLGTGAGTPLVGGYLCGGITGGLCAYNKAYDFKNTGTGASNPYPLLLGINCQSAGVWNIYNNMVCLTNGDPAEFKIIKPKYDETFKQVRVDNPPINLNAIPKDGSKVMQTPVVEGPKTPGVIDENDPNYKYGQQNLNVKTKNNNNNGKDFVNSTAVCTIAGFYHTNSTYKSPCNYYYNSVYIGGTMPGNSFNSYGFIRYSNNGLVNIQNNILVNARSGGGGYHYCIANESNTAQGWPANSTNYNLFIGANSTIGEWGAGNFLTLAQWQAATLGDANSISDNPTNVPGTTLFRNLGTDNLNIDTTQFGAAYVYQKGIGVPGITNDYNGYPRNTSGSVCVGAHEFTLNGEINVVLLTPSNNATLVARPVSMVWRKALFATGYRIQISNDSLFNNLLVNTTVSDSTYSYSTASPGTNYWWQVNPIYSSGANGQFSSTFKFTTAPIDPTALAQSNFNAVIIPQIMSCGGTTRMPVVVRATLTGLTPYTLYRFYNGGAAYTDIGTTAYGAGNPMFMNPDSAIYKYTTSVSLTTAGGYDQFRTSGSGTFTGWFCFVNTANARFAAGKYIIPSICLGDSLGTTLKRYALNDSIKVVNFSSSLLDTCGTGVYGISVALPKNIISLYDNTAGTGKPLAQTYIESEGVTVASIAPFYTTYAEGINGRWGTVIPNINTNGVRRVEQRNLSTGLLMTFNTNATGIWPSGANTVNPSGGLTPVGLLINDAPLLDAPVLAAPANGSLDISLTPAFTWSAVSFASAYRIQVSSDSTFATTQWDSAGITGTTVTMPSGKITASTKYYWKISGSTISGQGPWSVIWDFTTLPNAPNAPVLVSPANGATGQPVNITFVWRKAVETLEVTSLAPEKANEQIPFTDEMLTIAKYWLEYSTDSTFTTGVIRDSSLTDTTKSVSGLAQSTKFWWRVRAKNQTGWGSFSSAWNFTTMSLGLSLNLKVYLEGFWNGTNQVADTVNLYLAAATSPYTLVDSQKVLLTLTGDANPLFTIAPGGNYYIVVKHRNHLETWSRLPQTFIPGTPLIYDFTTDSAKAYGYNMKKAGSVWVLFGGDPNQDGSIDGMDIPIFISQFGNTGYLSCDFNGDGSVDAMDVIIIVQNFGMTKVVPTLILEPPEVRKQKQINMQNELKKIINKNTNKNNLKN